MQCISPLKASQNHSGDIVYSSRKAIPGLIGMQFPCRRCLPCRFNMGREKALRAYHESKCHPANSFLTLTYKEPLESPRLIYGHWQKFAKDLRDRIGYDPDKRITFMVTGEYGEENKRPHWHAIIFNYRPHDLKKIRTSERGDDLYSSETIDDLWSRNCKETRPSEIGDVTLESSSYVARYALKKLVHGKDQEHDFHPIHRTPSKRALGRSWIEQYYKFTFENGFCVLPNGSITKIPRYYVDWAQKNQPELWEHYVTEIRPKIIDKLEEQSTKEWNDYLNEIRSRPWGAPRPLTRPKVKETILQTKYKRLEETLKL